MRNKRHIVLYGLVAIGLAAIVGIKLAGFPAKVSYTTDIPLNATSTALTSMGNTSTTTMNSAASTTAPTPKPHFRLEVVTDLATQERGLGGRANIPQNYGMLFEFGSKSLVGFWMKDMLAPIDMIWLADDGSIVKIDDSVTPESYHGGTNPAVFYPPVPVRYVLETRAGEARRQGLHVGSHVPFTLP